MTALHDDLRARGPGRAGARLPRSSTSVGDQVELGGGVRRRRRDHRRHAARRARPPPRRSPATPRSPPGARTRPPPGASAAGCPAHLGRRRDSPAPRYSPRCLNSAAAAAMIAGAALLAAQVLELNHRRGDPTIEPLPGYEFVTTYLYGPGACRPPRAPGPAPARSSASCARARPRRGAIASPGPARGKRIPAAESPRGPMPREPCAHDLARPDGVSELSLGVRVDPQGTHQGPMRAARWRSWR